MPNKVTLNQKTTSVSVPGAEVENIYETEGDIMSAIESSYATSDMYLTAALLSLGCGRPSATTTRDTRTNKIKVVFTFPSVSPTLLAKWNAIPSTLEVNVKDFRDAKRWVDTTIHDLMDNLKSNIRSNDNGYGYYEER